MTWSPRPTPLPAGPYYLHPDDFIEGSLVRVPGGSFCEWKGQASYFDVVGPFKGGPGSMGW